MMSSFRMISSLMLVGLPLTVMTASGQSSAPTAKNNTAQGYVIFHEDVRRVPIDIVVTDKDGNPVSGLTKDDFIVKEDKAEQKILSFEYDNGSTPSYHPPKLPPLPANTYVNVPTEPEQGPLYVLYYDMVNTEMEDQMAFHNQLLDFVDKAQPGTRIAIFGNAAGLHLIQGFTNDHALLKAAILSKGPGPHFPDVFMDARNYGYQDPVAALSNLEFIADYLNGIPGRKNLLWLASAFPIPVGPTTTGASSVGAIGGGFSNSTPQVNDLTYLFEKMIQKTYSAMMRSQIALYPVDLAGVNAATAGGDTVTKDRYEDAIAEATGGHAYYGSNRIGTLLEKAVENGESYYALTYSPTNKEYDGSQRNIEITLANKKSPYTLTYRTLYYAVADDSAQTDYKPETVQARAMAAKTQDTLYANIEHGAPMLHDLVFSAHLATAGEPVLATPQQMLELQDSPAYFRTRHRDKPLKPLPPVKLQKYRINYGVIDPLLRAQARAHGTPAVLEFAAAAYDADGRLLNSMLNEGQAAADAANGSGALFRAEQELEVPAGAVTIRIAVRDKLTNRTGTLEVPLPLKPEAQGKTGKGD